MRRIAALFSIASLLCPLSAKSEQTSEYDQQYAFCVLDVVTQTSEAQSYAKSTSILEFCDCATPKFLAGYDISDCPNVKNVPESQVNSLFTF